MENASNHAKRAALRYCRTVKAPVQCRQICPDRHADEEMDCD
jgi:hypothetical protein